jgi:uncharacterized protein YgiB involved in biofilm formation
MLKRTRKRSAQITLILLGGAALVACDNQSERRDVYASMQDCVQDWSDESKCERAPDGAVTTARPHTGGGYFWGPRYFGQGYHSGSADPTALMAPGIGSHAIGSHVIGSQSIGRGGFGSSASGHSSGS